MKLKDLIKRVILKTLKALKILMDLREVRLAAPVPMESSTMLTLTTKESKTFIISAKNITPKAKTLSTRSIVNTIVKTKFNWVRTWL